MLLALVLVSVACNRKTRRVTALLGGDGIETATRVTAYRIDPMKRGGIHGYAKVAGPVEVDDATRAELADVFLDDATYRWDSAKACEFLPGVMLRYEGSGTTDVLLCFSCDELTVYRDDRRVGREDFDSRRTDLVRVAKRLFPDLSDLE